MWSTFVRRRSSVAMPWPLVELDARGLEPEPLDERRAPDRDEHEVGLDGLALAEVDGERGAGVLDLRARLAELEPDSPLAELLGELRRGVLVLRRDQPRQHLDDRHLGAEAGEDRRELGADDPAAEDDEALRHLGLREEAGRVDAARRVEALDRRTHRERARRDDRALERDVLSADDGDRVRVRELALAVGPDDAVRLEERCDPARHLLDDAGLPGVRGLEVELRLHRP